MQSIDAILVDAGTGNLHSVHNALKNLRATIQVASHPEEIIPGKKIILPGVGAFAAFMQGIKSKSLLPALIDALQREEPILGICVGMQALFQIGEEMGSHPGIGALEGKVIRFPDFKELKVPHTGWNQLWFQKPSPLFSGMINGCYAYFNHGYYCDPADKTCISTLTDYGIEFASSVQSGKLFGVQFHPEKSQMVGQQILQNFLRI